MKTEFMIKTSRFFNNAGLKIKKHSPEILMVAGIAGTVASTIMACKATTKIDEVLNDTKYKVDIIHESKELGHVIGREDAEYTEDHYKRDLTITYVQSGAKLLKLYAPAIALGALSITSIVAGHNILKKRNIALAAAYAVVDRGFKDYRKNVVERFGEELDKELRYGIKTKEFEEVVVDKNGKEKVEKNTVSVINPELNVSEYAKFYDDGNRGWEKDPELNLMFLRHQQQYANDLLRAKGHLFLNEVYDMLGIPRTKAGQVVGWIYKGEDVDGNRPDSYVDFGIYDMNRESCRNFVNGYERTILLDFNVDGPILDLI